MWKVIDTGSRSPDENMEIDRELLSHLHPDDQPILHLYSWSVPSATYGYFVDPARFLNKAKAVDWGLQLARRPTGGGIVFHTSDLAFSVLVPSGHEAYSGDTLAHYRYVNERVLDAVAGLAEIPSLLPLDPVAENEAHGRFCMAKPTIYDVMVGGKKIAGAAQRTKGNGFLHQGSIAIQLPEKKMLQDLLDPAIIEAMEEVTFVLGGKIEQRREQLRKALIGVFV